MSDSEAAPYELLVAMIEHELELATGGGLAELRRANDTRRAVMAQLLANPPAAALPSLERAELVHARLTIELQRRREALLEAIAELERTRRAARGYAPPSHRRPRFSSSA